MHYRYIGMHKEMLTISKKEKLLMYRGEWNPLMQFLFNDLIFCSILIKFMLACRIDPLTK